MHSNKLIIAHRVQIKFTLRRYMHPRSYFKVVLSGWVIISLDYGLLKERHASEPAMSNTRIMKIKEEIVRVMVQDTEFFQNLQSGVFSSIRLDISCKSTSLKNTAEIGLEFRQFIKYSRRNLFHMTLFS